jgi:hypothetical protein
MSWRNDLRDLIDALAYGVLYAPDEFPQEDFLAPDEQMTFPRFAGELRERLQSLSGSLRDKVDSQFTTSILEDAIRSYAEGRRNEGAWKLQELEGLLRKV